MEWIIGITAVCVVLYFMSSGGSKKRSAEIAKAVAVKDFIDEGRAYTQEEAVQTIERFVLALGDTQDYAHTRSANSVAKSFPQLLKKMKKEYREELRDLKEEITNINGNYKDEINDVKSDPDLAKDEKREEIAELKIKWEEELNPFKHDVNRREKQISALDENPKEALEKALVHIKKEHSEGNPLSKLNDDFLAYELAKESSAKTHSVKHF